MKQAYKFLLLTGTLFCAQFALANNGDTPRPDLPVDKNVVHGVVVDATTKKPVAGVIVSVSNQNKKVKKEVATDASGYFKLDELPAGQNHIYFDKKGYKILKKSSVTVKDKAVLKLNVDLEEEGRDAVFEHPALRLLDGIF